MIKVNVKPQANKSWTATAHTILELSLESPHQARNHCQLKTKGIQNR